MTIKQFRILAALLVSVAFVAFAVAQERPIPTFSEIIDVRVVNLEAVVTDQDGVRVSGLGPESFRLEVDGKEVSIRYFTEVLGGVAVGRPGGDIEAVPSLAPGRAVGTSYLVFIDDFFSNRTDRNAVLQNLMDQVTQMRPEDRMAVVAFDGRKLDMLSTWSQSHEELTRVLRRAQGRKAYGSIRAADQRNADALQRTGTYENFRGGQADAHMELNIGERESVMKLTIDLQRTTLAAVSALRGFAGPPGRRAMVLLSGGWPADPVRWVVRTDDAGVLGREVVDDVYRTLRDTANRLSYTLYTVDVPGQAPPSGLVNENSVRGSLQTQNLAFFREQEEELSLSRLADATGGRAFLNGSRMNALEQVVEDTRSYYWLGFVPNWKGDDESHDIRIRLVGKGLKLRSREGYTDLSRTSEVNMMVESALLFGDPPSTEPLLVRPGRPEKGGSGRMVVPLSITIPMDALTFLPTQEGFVAETELRIAVLDDDGDRNEMPVIPLKMKLAEKPEPGVQRRYDTAVKLRKKKHSLVIAIYDTMSGKMLSTKIEVNPG